MKIDIKGTIVSNDDKTVYDYFGIEAVCPKDVAGKLKEANGEPITAEINSGGGDLEAGNEIYYLLNTYKGDVNIDILGFAGSAASVVAMSRKCRIIPSGLMMIHNVSSNAYGDFNSMNKMSDMLKTANKAVSYAYKCKTGLSEETLLQLMNKETWLTAKECIKMGFVDEIINNNNVNLYNSYCSILNSETIEKVKNMLNKPITQNSDTAFFISKSKLNLLKLGGRTI